METRLQGM